mgnify:CR=1 FL=1
MSRLVGGVPKGALERIHVPLFETHQQLLTRRIGRAGNQDAPIYATAESGIWSLASIRDAESRVMPRVNRYS